MVMMRRVGDNAWEDGTGAVRRLFFLRGRMRSGTTWLGRLLNLHPRINIQGEYHFERIWRGVDGFTDFEQSLGTRHGGVREAAWNGFRDTVRRCMLATAPDKPGADWIGDRTPTWIFPLLEESPHIVVFRDGRDHVVSLTFLALRERPDKNARIWEDLPRMQERFRENPHRYSEHPEELLSDEAWVRHIARKWAYVVTSDADTLERVERGDTSLRVHVVWYERLRADTEGERRRMYGFLDLDPGEAEALSEASSTLPGRAGGERPDDPFRKGEVGDWRNYFVDERAKRWFNEEAGEALVRLGYETSTDW